jgi:diaminopimelate decarboxylase
MRGAPVEQRSAVSTRVPEPVTDRIGRLHASTQLPVGAYLYDPAIAAAKALRLVEALPDWAEVFYAVKANSFPPVLRALGPVVAGFDVASLHEAELACAAATATAGPPRLASSGPGKTEQHLRGLLALRAELVNIESMLELQRLARLADSVGQRPQITVRVKPAALHRAGSVRIGGQPTPFGVDERAVPSVLAAAKTLPSVDVVGFQFHEACNNLDAESHAAYVQWCLDWSTQTAAAHGVDLRVVDVGGGIGIGPGDETAFDVGLFGRCVAAIRPPNNCRVVLEPGRYLVAECGYYATEVVDVKQTLGTWYAVVRGGINHFLRPALGDYAGTIRVVPVDDWPSAYARPGVHNASITVVGELCSPSDVLAQVSVDQLRAGDILVFSMAGSYGWELALQAFLGHPPAVRTTVTEAQ